MTPFYCTRWVFRESLKMGAVPIIGAAPIMLMSAFLLDIIFPLGMIMKRSIEGHKDDNKG